MTTTTTSEHDCHDCGKPIPVAAEIFLGSGTEQRAFHQDCFEHPAGVPEQRISA